MKVSSCFYLFESEADWLQAADGAEPLEVVLVVEAEPAG